MGGHNSAMQWNRESDDATLPVQSPAGVAQSKPPPPTGPWQRVEIKVGADGIQTWLNGTEAPGLRADSESTPDIDAQWGTTYRPKPTDFGLGWESYGVGATRLWFDDVALGNSRISC